MKILMSWSRISKNLHKLGADIYLVKYNRFFKQNCLSGDSEQLWLVLVPQSPIYGGRKKIVGRKEDFCSEIWFRCVTHWQQGWLFDTDLLPVASAFMWRSYSAVVWLSHWHIRNIHPCTAIWFLISPNWIQFNSHALSTSCLSSPSTPWLFHIKPPSYQPVTNFIHPLLSPLWLCAGTLSLCL